MDEEHKQRIAFLFRFGVIADLVGRRKLEPGKREAIIRELADQQWDIPFSTKTSISRSTIREWLRRYRLGGERLESLFPKEREDAGVARSIDPETELALVELKRQLPPRTPLSVLLRVARQPQDRRRFEAELPNDLWQADCMHGPRVLVDGTARKSYLFACIDDHSRLITAAGFSLRENLECFQDCLLRALAARGLPRKLYVDNGPLFRSQRLSYACASLGIALLFATPYTPQGKGPGRRGRYRAPPPADPSVRD